MDKAPHFCWYASLRHVEGDGYIPPFTNTTFPEQKNFVVIHCIDQLDGERLHLWWKECQEAVKDNGYLCLLCYPNKPIPNPEGFALAESSMIGDKLFRAWKKAPTVEQRPLPDILIFRDGHAQGDAIQAAAVAEYYKKCHPDKRVSLMVRENVIETVKYIPGVEAIPMQGTINNDHIPLFVEFWQSRVGLLVNLDWSVEGTILKYGGNRDYFWTHEQRKHYCKKNYNENVAMAGGMGEPLRIKFYPKPGTEETAKEKASKKPYIAIALRGSAIHKWYPYNGEFINQLLSAFHYDVVLLGDHGSKIMARDAIEKVGWSGGDIGRVHDLTGQTTMGESILIAKHSVCCIAPETAIPLAIGHEDTPKVMIISQSSYENFSDLKNCVMIQGTVPCSPCHRHHNDFTFCKQDERTGASACQAAISPGMLLEAVRRAVQPIRQYSAPLLEEVPVQPACAPETPPPKTSHAQDTTAAPDSPGSTTAKGTRSRPSGGKRLSALAGKRNGSSLESQAPSRVQR